MLDPKMVLILSLHIKVGLTKHLVKALDQDLAAFKNFLEFFPKLSKAKIKVGRFVALQIKKVLDSTEFSDKLSSVGRFLGSY